ECATDDSSDIRSPPARTDAGKSAYARTDAYVAVVLLGRRLGSSVEHAGSGALSGRGQRRLCIPLVADAPRCVVEDQGEDEQKDEGEVHQRVLSKAGHAPRYDPVWGADPPLWTVLARHLVPINDERPPQVAFHRVPLRRGDVVKGEVVFHRLGRALDARVTH